MWPIIIFSLPFLDQIMEQVETKQLQVFLNVIFDVNPFSEVSGCSMGYKTEPCRTSQSKPHIQLISDKFLCSIFKLRFKPFQSTSLDTYFFLQISSSDHGITTLMVVALVNDFLLTVGKGCASFLLRLHLSSAFDMVDQASSVLPPLVCEVPAKQHSVSLIDLSLVHGLFSPEHCQD